MNDDLKCPDCGVRHFLTTTVLGADGNPSGGDWRPLFVCAGCERAYDLQTDGETVTLKKVLGFKSVVGWRAL